MAKKGLLSKLRGKQDSSCCSVSFEEVSGEDTGEGREERAERESGREEAKAKAGERHKAADESL